LFFIFVAITAAVCEGTFGKGPWFTANFLENKLSLEPGTEWVLEVTTEGVLEVVRHPRDFAPPSQRIRKTAKVPGWAGVLGALGTGSAWQSGSAAEAQAETQAERAMAQVSLTAALEQAWGDWWPLQSWTF
jgi:hypothetical protein